MDVPEQRQGIDLAAVDAQHENEYAARGASDGRDGDGCDGDGHQKGRDFDLPLAGWTFWGFVLG